MVKYSTVVLLGGLYGAPNEGDDKLTRFPNDEKILWSNYPRCISNQSSRMGGIGVIFHPSWREVIMGALRCGTTMSWGRQVAMRQHEVTNVL